MLDDGYKHRNAVVFKWKNAGLKIQFKKTHYTVQMAGTKKSYGYEDEGTDGELFELIQAHIRQDEIDVSSSSDDESTSNKKE